MAIGGELGMIRALPDLIALDDGEEGGGGDKSRP